MHACRGFKHALASFEQSNDGHGARGQDSPPQRRRTVSARSVSHAPLTKDFSLAKRLKEKVTCESLYVGVQHHNFSNGYLHPACWIAAPCTTEVINQGSWRAACFSTPPKVHPTRSCNNAVKKIAPAGSAINVMDLTDRFFFLTGAPARQPSSLVSNGEGLSQAAVVRSGCLCG
jgi:hypothetical protein